MHSRHKTIKTKVTDRKLRIINDINLVSVNAIGSNRSDRRRRQATRSIRQWRNIVVAAD